MCIRHLTPRRRRYRSVSEDFEQENRGLPPDQAIRMYASTLNESKSRDLFTSMKKVHSSASINVEALRKLVKVRRWFLHVHISM